MLALVGCAEEEPVDLVQCDGVLCSAGEYCDPAWNECTSRPICKTASNADTFEVPNGVGCGVWGTPFGSGRQEVRNGVLALTPDSTEPSGCVTYRTGPESGAQIEIARVPPLTDFTFSLVSDFRIVMSITVSSSDMDRRWLRLRPYTTPPGGMMNPFPSTFVIAEVSPDGLSWKRVNSSTGINESRLAYKLSTGPSQSTEPVELASAFACPDGTEP